MVPNGLSHWMSAPRPIRSCDSDEEISEIARKNWVGMKTGNGGSNKVVPVDNVEEYISDGWEYVNMLPGDKVVMRFPF